MARRYRKDWRINLRLNTGLVAQALILEFLLGYPRLGYSQVVPETDTVQTSGICSPVVLKTGGSVSVTINCSGVDPKALQRLNELLDKKDLELVARIKEADDWASKYRALYAQIENADDGGRLAQSAKESLASGKLEEAKTSLVKLEAQLEAEKEGAQGYAKDNESVDQNLPSTNGERRNTGRR